MVVPSTWRRQGAGDKTSPHLRQHTCRLDEYGGTQDLAVVGSVRHGPVCGPRSAAAFNSDDDKAPLPAPVAQLRTEIAAADAVLFCTPEYAGTLPGSLKNLLDWTVGGGEMYGKPVGWINVAAAGRGEGACASLRSVLGYVGAVVMEEACARLPLGREMIGDDGLLATGLVRDALPSVLAAIAAHLAHSPASAGGENA